MSEAPKPLPAREAARRRQPLDGADAQALEGALGITERERDEARALSEERRRALEAQTKETMLQRERAEQAEARIAELEGEQERTAYSGEVIERLEKSAAEAWGKYRAEKVAWRGQCAELHEHLALVVQYLTEETSQGDGIAEEHHDGYVAAKELLDRLQPQAPQWEESLVYVSELRERAELAEARVVELQDLLNDSDTALLDEAAAELAKTRLQRDACAESRRACIEIIEQQKAELDRVTELVRKAHKHWDAIRWPEDKRYIAMLAEALEPAQKSISQEAFDALPDYDIVHPNDVHMLEPAPEPRCRCQWEAGDSPCPVHGDE